MAELDDIQEDVPVEVPEDDGANHARLRIRRLLPNRRIDKYLQHRFPGFSRNMIQGLIEEAAVTVNGRPTKNSYQIKPGDQIDLILPPLPSDDIEPEYIPLNIIYEDEHFLAINKQTNLIVHPARGNRSGTLVNGLVYYCKTLSQVNEAFRPGIVHRLDRNTTGVMVVAKTDTAHWRLAHQFEHRQTRKTYIAIVHGTMDVDGDAINMPLGKHPYTREKYAVRLESGKEAYTEYQVQQQFNGYALVKVMPRTGRTHQIRVHMSYIKHPIVSDTMYGGKKVSLEQLANGVPLPEGDEPGGTLKPEDIIVDRQALHAAVLEIRHPVSAEPMRFEAPLPPDMELMVKLMERYRPLRSP